MTIDPDTLCIEDCRTEEERLEDVAKAVTRAFENAAKGRPENEQKVLKDLAPVISDAVSAAIRAYNPRPKPHR